MLKKQLPCSDASAKFFTIHLENSGMHVQQCGIIFLYTALLEKFLSDVALSEYYYEPHYCISFAKYTSVMIPQVGI